MLLEEATEAGLVGASFFRRALSSPFSGGECAGLTRGVAGSWECKCYRVLKLQAGVPALDTGRQRTWVEGSWLLTSSLCPSPHRWGEHKPGEREE